MLQTKIDISSLPSEASISLLYAGAKNPAKQDKYIGLVQNIADLEKQTKEYEKIFIHELDSEVRQALDNLVVSFLGLIYKGGDLLEKYFLTSQKFEKKRQERKEEFYESFGDEAHDVFSEAEDVEKRLNKYEIDCGKILRRVKKIRKVLSSLKKNADEETKKEFKYADIELKRYQSKFSFLE